MEKPVIAITMGDAAGIGPEIVTKVLARREVHRRCRPLVVGDLGVMEQIGEVLGGLLPIRPRFRLVEHVQDAEFAFPVIDVLCPEGAQVGRVEWGQLDAKLGAAAGKCLGDAYRLAMGSLVTGVVSAPLNKEAFHLAGYDYADELGYLADLTGSSRCYMMGVVRSVWTVALAEHVPFREIADRVKREDVLWHILAMDRTLKRSGIGAPRLAVAALNVHAGEGGLIGREEIDEIAPAVHDAQARGVDVTGPVPADMVFVRAFEGDFDGVVCMYHDQANIARKLQPKSEGATLFMGLPVACGTTAHGTAFDKAGQGIADPGSLAAALEYTIRLSNQGGEE
jgi:4-hydroxythreonine-4-phosphate dehydrogenase